jgi:hypothetical protein
LPCNATPAHPPFKGVLHPVAGESPCRWVGHKAPSGCLISWERRTTVLVLWCAIGADHVPAGLGPNKDVITHPQCGIFIQTPDWNIVHGLAWIEVRHRASANAAKGMLWPRGQQVLARDPTQVLAPYLDGGRRAGPRTLSTLQAVAKAYFRIHAHSLKSNATAKTASLEHRAPPTVCDGA